MGKITDEDFEQLSSLAARAQAGDIEAYDQLLRRLYPYVGGIIRMRLGRVVDVDDVIQESLLAVHKSLATYRPSKSFKPWLLAILRYKVADHLRTVARRREITLDESKNGVTNPVPTAKRLGEDRKISSDEVRSLVSSLPDELQRAVTLTKMQGLSTTEAAEIERISNQALRKRVSRAYRKLAALAKILEADRGEG